jgi:type IV pilus assembly protein PilY1
VTTNAVDWNAKDGWVLDFNPANASPGERVNIDPELVLGTLIVTTNVPIAATGGASCSVGGDSWQYQFDFRTGSFVPNATGAVAGTKTGSVVTVGVAVIQLPSGAIKTIITGADTSKTTGGVNIGAGAGTVRRFSYRER